MHPFLFGVVFFASGFCALVYELVWVRLIGLSVGHATLAVSLVLSSYMAGLALGSWGYSWSQSFRRRWGWEGLRLYAGLELAIALLALAAPWMIEVIEGAWLETIRQSGTSYLIKVGIRALLASPVVLLPTFLMGATFPAAVSIWEGAGRSLKESCTKLYALNLAGGMTGVLLATFWGFSLLGIEHALWVAVAVNVVLAGLVGWAGWKKSTIPFDQPVQESVGRQKIGKGVVLTLAGAGAAAMMAEVLWTRLYILTLGSSVYAFSIVLLTFLGGLALGSWLSNRSALLRPDGGTVMVALAAGLAGLFIILSMPLVEWLPTLFVYGHRLLPKYPFWAHVLQFGLCVGGLLIPAMLMGMVFPLVSAAFRSPEEVAVGYAANTMGNILGPLAALVAFPMIGSQKGLWVAAGIYGGVAVGWVMASRENIKKRLVIGMGIAGGYAVLMGSQASWDLFRLTSAPFLFVTKNLQSSQSGPAFTPGHEDTRAEMVFFREGFGATVSVKRYHENYLSLQINGKTDASTGIDMMTQLLSGHLPFLLHSEAREAAVIGLGSGVTAGAILRHPVTRLDVVELEAEVVNATVWFRPFSGFAPEDPRVRMVMDDGRNFLLLTNHRYDVLTVEPSNPWMAGNASLFTREFYQRCVSRLRSDGIMCQWLQAYGMRDEDLQTAFRTFAEEFPHAAVWAMSAMGIRGAPADMLMIGSSQPISLDRGVLTKGFERARPQLDRVALRNIDQVLSGFLMDRRGMLEFADGAPRHSDDFPILEFSAPRNLYDPSIKLGEILSRLMARRQPLPPRL